MGEAEARAKGYRPARKRSVPLCPGTYRRVGASGETYRRIGVWRIMLFNFSRLLACFASLCLIRDQDTATPLGEDAQTPTRSYP